MSTAKAVSSVALLRELEETRASIDSLSYGFKSALSKPQAASLALSKRNGSNTIISSGSIDKENASGGGKAAPGSAEKRHFRLRQMYDDLVHLR